jgi:hypothetical protein
MMSATKAPKREQRRVATLRGIKKLQGIARDLEAAHDGDRAALERTRRAITTWRLSQYQAQPAKRRAGSH